MLGEGLHCGLDIWGELSRGQTAPSLFPFPALSTPPPLRNADSRTHDNPQMEHGVASLPAVRVFVLARGNSCCPAARCSPLSTAEEKGSGQRREDIQARPHAAPAPQAWPCPPAAEPNPAGPLQRQILLYQQRHVGISKLHVEVTLWCTLGEGKLISLHLNPPK